MPEVCTGFLEFRNETKALERERNYCRTPQFKDFCERSVRQISFDSIRQREHGGLHQYAGRSESKPHKCSYQHLILHGPKSDTGKSKAFEWEQELRCRSAIPLFEQIRMDDTSTCIPISRHYMGSTHMRQVRILPHHTGYKVQVNPCRSSHQWGRCIGSDGLEQRKQFHKCSFETIRQNNVKNRVPESNSNGHSTGVDGNAVVQQTTTPFNLRPYQIAKGKIVLPPSGLTNTRTSSKQKVEMVRLESFWLNKFSARHWNENCLPNPLWSSITLTLQSIRIFVSTHVVNSLHRWL